MNDNIPIIYLLYQGYPHLGEMTNKGFTFNHAFAIKWAMSASHRYFKEQFEITDFYHIPI